MKNIKINVSRDLWHLYNVLEECLKLYEVEQDIYDKLVELLGEVGKAVYGPITVGDIKRTNIILEVDLK